MSPTSKNAQPGPGPAQESGGASSAGEATHASDMALVREIQAGSAGAWQVLLDRYQQRLFGVCFRMSGNADTAADLTQDAMVRIVQGIGSYDGRASLFTWMTRICINTCLTWLRSQKLRRHQSLDAREGGADSWGPEAGREGEGSGKERGRDSKAVDRLGALGSDNTTSHDAARARSIRREASRQGGELSVPERVQMEERRLAVARCLGTIDPEQRAILILRDVQGLDYEQIAQVLGVAVGTVKSRLFRARLALRNAIEAED